MKRKKTKLELTIYLVSIIALMVLIIWTLFSSHIPYDKIMASLAVIAFAMLIVTYELRIYYDLKDFKNNGK